jgi:uncharacterized protein
MIIDAHAHACGSYLYPEDIIRIMDKNKTDKTILVPGELNNSKTYSLPELAKIFPKKDVLQVMNKIIHLTTKISGVSKHIYEGNYRVYDIVSKYPDRLIQFYWASPDRVNILSELSDHFKQWHFKGIKFHQCWERFSVRSVIFDKIAQFAFENDLPIFIHLWSAKEADYLIEYISRHPDLCIIVAHLFAIEKFIASNINLNNVYFELSPPALISQYRLHLALKHFGSDRLILGTDTPYGKNNLSINMNRVKLLNISEEEKKRILGLNIAEIVKLK